MISFRAGYRVGCVVTAFLVTLWQIYQYHLDNDLVQIDFKKIYSADERVYPELTLCGNSVTISKLNGSTQETPLNDTFNGANQDTKHSK